MESVLGLVRHAGNDSLFRAIEMSLLATSASQPLHLHAEGLRGTGKTSIMRAVRRVLPRIRRIRGCLYNCDPSFPHCPDHRGLTREAVDQLGDEWVPMPFLEISHSAKVGTVVGSIDLGRLVNPTQPEAALLPGTIPQAHRGIIFVDEINRLAETAPELADILLDVMGTKPGRVQIEETGLPAVELPVQVTVWAASNPDEDPGPLEDIRRQLSDRFDLVVYTDRPGEVAVVEQILNAGGGAGWHRPLSPSDETQAELFRTRLATRVPALRQVTVPGPLRQQVADLYSRFNVESLRAVQAIHLGVRLTACLDQRTEATPEDLARIAPLALRHRVDPDTLKRVTGHLSGMNRAGEAQPAAAKPRFSSVSFGGAVADAAPAPAPAAPQASGTATGLKAQQAATQPNWPTQYPPRPQLTGPGAESSAGWLTRTMAGLRRNLGLEAGAPAQRPEPAPPDGRGHAQRQAASLPPRPGRLFNRAGQEGAAPGVGQGSPGSLTGGARSGRQERAAAEQQPQVYKPDPLQMTPIAPPNRARPLSELEPQDFIRTEEELGRR